MSFVMPGMTFLSASLEVKAGDWRARLLSCSRILDLTASLPNTIYGGEELPGSIMEAVGQARLGLGILSPTYFEKKWPLNTFLYIKERFQLFVHDNS